MKGENVATVRRMKGNNEATVRWLNGTLTEDSPIGCAPMNTSFLPGRLPGTRSTTGRIRVRCCGVYWTAC